MKNNRGELSARAPGFVIYGIKPGPRPGLDVYLTLLFLPSQTDAIHHVRHLTVQSVLKTLDLGYSTRWNLWGLERRLAANSEFSAEGELTVYIITYHIYIFCTLFILFTIRWLRSITLLVLPPNHVNLLLRLFNGIGNRLSPRYALEMDSIWNR